VSLFDKYLLVLATGIGIIIVPVVFWSIISDSSISDFFIILDIIVVAFFVISISLQMKQVKNDFFTILDFFKKLKKASVIEKFASIAIGFFIIKNVFYLSIVPINVDALYFHLPSALYFIRFGHIFPYADPPVASLLYAWSYPSTNNLIAEPFRQIPLLFIISAPILVYSIAKYFLPKKYSLVTLILFVFSPFMDTAVYLWPWHTDLIAGTLGIMAIYFLIKDFKWHEVFSGLSLCLAILTKTPFGLAAGIVIAVLFLSNSKHKSLNTLIVAFAGFLITFLGIDYSFSLLSASNNLIFAIIGSVITISILVFSFYRTHISLKLNVLAFFLPLSPAIVWVSRQVYLGGQPLALPIFPNQLSGAAWWGSFVSQIQSVSGLHWNVSGLTLLFYHPLLAATLFPLIITGFVYAFKRGSLHFLVTALIVYYFLWFSIFSTGAAYRHLYPLVLMMYPLIGLGFASFIRIFKIRSSKIEFFIIIFLILLECTQSMVIYLNYSVLSFGPLKSFLHFLTIGSPWLNYDIITGSLLSLVITFSILVVSIFLVGSLLGRVNLRLPTNTYLKRSKQIVVFVILCGFSFSLMISPITYLIFTRTNGVPSTYPYVGSWYSSEIDLSSQIKEEMTSNGMILTYGFDAFYYLALNNITYFDLLDGNIASYPFRGPEVYSVWRQAVETTDIKIIASVFSYFNIQYILLPTSRCWSYQYYERFNQLSSMFKILIERNSMGQIKTFQDYTLYKVDFNKTLTFDPLISGNVTQRSDWIGYGGNWGVSNGTFVGNYSNVFGSLILDSANLENFELESKVMGIGKLRESGLIFRWTNSSNYYLAFIGSNQLRVMKMYNNSAVYPPNWVKWFSSDNPTQPDLWHKLKVVAIGNTFYIYLNDTLQLRIEDSDSIPAGKVGLGGFDDFSYFTNVSVEKAYYNNPLN
jgi:hypothetical protein